MNPHRIAALLATALSLATLPAAATPTERSGAPATTLNAATRRAVVTGAITRLKAQYVFPEKVAAIAKAVQRKLSSGAYDAITDPKAFARAVTQDMQAVAHDRHLALLWSSRPLPASEPSADAGEAAAEAERLARSNYAIPRAEVLPGNVGYLRIDAFVPAQVGGATMAAAMEFLRHTDALIVDLRHNGGGEPDMVQLAASYLLPPATLINTFHQRGKDVRDQFWTLPYVPGGRWSLDKPLFVLTGPGTASAAEEYAYDVQQLKRGTIVGEATWGGANPGEVTAIDTHFAIFIPNGAAINPVSGTNWEGTGVTPDVAVPAGTALAEARRLALQALIAGSDGERRAELEKLLADAAATSAD